MAPRDVNYEYRVVGDLPQRETRPSQLEDGVEYVKTQVEHGKATIIADYANRTAAAAAVNVLRKRHGLAEASGLHFETHVDKNADSPTNGRALLFVVHHPGWVTQDGQDQFAAQQAALESKKLADKEKRKSQAAARKAGGGETAVADEAVAGQDAGQSSKKGKNSAA